MMMILIKTLVAPRITPASNSWLTTHEEKKEENHLQYIVHMIVSSTLKQKQKNNKKKKFAKVEVNLSIFLGIVSMILIEEIDLISNLKNKAHVNVCTYLIPLI